MRQNLILSNRVLFLLLFFLLVGNNSCKKVATEEKIILTVDQLPDNLKVHPEEFAHWMAKLPVKLPFPLEYSKAQQAVINGKHVVKIPITSNGNDAALFVTKVNDSLKVFGYKWRDETPAGKKFTGRIFSFSLQDYKSRMLFYNDGVITKMGIAITSSPQNTPSLLSKDAKNTTLWDVISAIGTAIGQAGCWLTGGDWGYDDTRGAEGCIDRWSYGSGSDGGDGGSGSDYGMGDYGTSGDYGTGGGIPGNGGGDPGYGGGSSWTPTTDGPSPSDFSMFDFGPSVAVTASTIIEPNGYDVVTDQATGITYTYNDIQDLINNNPQLVNQIDDNDDSQPITGPSPIFSTAGLDFTISYLKEIKILQIVHPEWSKAKIYSVALWDVVGGTTHFILDIAGFVPLIGDAASLINGAIYYVEGDHINCALSLAAMIPVTGWVQIAGKWVKETVTSVPIINAAGKVAYRAVQVGKDYRLIKVAVSIFDYASIKALKAIAPADRTLTNISRYLIDNYCIRIAPSETALKTLVDDIVQLGDATGSRTEQLSDALLQREGYVKQASQYGSNNGFDGVYMKLDANGNPTDIIINEAKQMSTSGNIKLNPAAGKAAQMSDTWVNQTIDEMRNIANDLGVLGVLEPFYIIIKL